MLIAPDTNVLLHYKRADLVNWEEVTGGAEPTIVLLPTVIGEIDKHKDSSRDPHLRKKAAAISSWIGRIIDDDPQPGALPVELILRHPRSLPPDLDLSNADDRIIASVFELQAAGRDVLVVSSDNLLLAKLKAQHLRGVRPAEINRLSAPKDDATSRIEKLQAEVAQLRSREPKVALVFQSGAAVSECVVSPVDTSGLQPLARIMERRPLLADPRTMSPAEFAKGPRIALSIGQLETYNSRVSEYWRAYERWRTLEIERRVRRTRLILLKLKALNSGAGPATDVRFTLSIPEQLRLVLSDEELGPAYEPPSDIGNPGQTFYSGTPPARISHSWQRLIPQRTGYEPDNHGWPSVDEGRRQVTITLDKLQQGNEGQMRVFAALLPADCPAGLRIPYKVYCDELASPTSGALLLVPRYGV